MLVIGIAGTELHAAERDWLQHPAVGGVILFTRNFASRAQVTELAASLRQACPRPLLLCVDQEGGRVQRFREVHWRLQQTWNSGYRRAPPTEGPLYDRPRHGSALRPA